MGPCEAFFFIPFSADDLGGECIANEQMVWVCPKLGDSGGRFNGKMRSETVRSCGTVAAKNNGFNITLKPQLVLVSAAFVSG